MNSGYNFYNNDVGLSDLGLNDQTTFDNLGYGDVPDLLNDTDAAFGRRRGSPRKKSNTYFDFLGKLSGVRTEWINKYKSKHPRTSGRDLQNKFISVVASIYNMDNRGNINPREKLFSYLNKPWTIVKKVKSARKSKKSKSKKVKRAKSRLSKSRPVSKARPVSKSKPKTKK